MKRSSALFLLGFFMIASGAQAIGGPQLNTPTGQRALAGEVIVKFLPDSKPAQVAAAVVRGEAGAGSDLSIVASTLSDALRLPLRIDRVTSGQELVIAIRTDVLAAGIVSRLMARDDVEEVSLLEDRPEAQRLAGSLRMRVGLAPEGRMAEALSRAATKAARQDSVVRNLTSPVKRETGFPLQTERVEVRQILLFVDLEALTEGLVNGLKDRGDVEYVQRNILMRPLGGSGITIE